MQSLLFLVEDGDSHRSRGNLGMALKRYHAIQKVFNEAEDDQGDAEEDVRDVLQRTLGSVGLEERMRQTAERSLQRSEDEDDQAEAGVRLIKAATVSRLPVVRTWGSQTSRTVGRPGRTR